MSHNTTLILDLNINFLEELAPLPDAQKGKKQKNLIMDVWNLLITCPYSLFINYHDFTFSA